MTVQEAINIITNLVPKTCKVVDGRLKGGFDDWDSDAGKALKMAIEALKKQENIETLKEALIEELNCNCYWTQATFDEDGFCNDDSEQVIDIDKAIEIVEEVMKA